MDLIRSNQTYQLGNHLWFNGIKKGKQKDKRIEINSILITKEKILEIGLFKHIGHTLTDVIMWQALREYFIIHPQLISFNVHLLTRSSNIRNCIEGKSSHRDFKNI